MSYKLTAYGDDTFPDMVDVFTFWFFAASAARSALKVYPAVRVEKL
jgi:hypothetical protein